MKTARTLLASLATLFACLAHAADSNTSRRVVAILDVETDDPAAYATWIKQYNEVAKAKLGIDNYLRVYESVFDSRENPARVRVVTSAPSVAELFKNSAALETDPGIIENLSHLRAIRKTGARVLYQSVRSEGTTAKGAHNYNTLANLSDEAAYLKAIEELRAIFDANGFKDAKIFVYRVIAGRADHSHRITINTPSRERLAAFLDFVGTNPQAQTWIANSGKIRTVVANTTSREITK